MITSRLTPSSRHRGLTLLELMVASGIMLTMSLVMLTLLMQNQRSSRKAMGHSETSAQVAIVQDKLSSELRGCRVFGVSESGALQYWRCQMVDGIPQLDPQGRPNWLPGSPADPALAELSVQQGFLWRTFQGQRQVVAPVGPDGRVQFDWSPASNILTLEGNLGERHAYAADRNNIQAFRFQLCLSNME
jgi:hypothetical protein